MERFTRRGALALGAGAGALLAGCSSKFIGYDGPGVTRVQIRKSARQMVLFHHQVPLTVHEVQLGFTATGPKRFEGDGRTPEGRYHIDRRNPNSDFYLSIGIDYPNDLDRLYAAEMNRRPGGDIFIHGWGDERRAKKRSDWTAGCVAVTDKEMKHVYAMVRDGTPIDIYV